MIKWSFCALSFLKTAAFSNNQFLLLLPKPAQSPVTPSLRCDPNPIPENFRPVRSVNEGLGLPCTEVFAAVLLSYLYATRILVLPVWNFSVSVTGRERLLFAGKNRHGAYVLQDSRYTRSE